MASIVAYLELREGAVTRPSRSIVAEARRVADAAGATVYALVTVGELPQAEIDQLASGISAAGADRILCSSAKSLAGPPLHVTHGPLLAQVAEHLRPVLFLFPAGGTGTELGPSLALRIGAAYLANASIEVAAEPHDHEPPLPRVLLSRWRGGRDALRRIDLGEFERPVVASLNCGRVPPELGEPYAEVEMLPCPEPPASLPRLIACERDPAAQAELCSAMLWSDGPIDSDLRSLLPSDLPAGALLRTSADLDAMSATSPCQVFDLSAVSRDAPPRLPHLAPGAEIVRVRKKNEVPA